MTINENSDLVKLKEECSKLRGSAFSAIKNALRMSEVELKSSGYKSIELAAVRHFKYYSDKIEKLTEEFFRKYPDEK